MNGYVLLKVFVFLVFFVIFIIILIILFYGLYLFVFYFFTVGALTWDPGCDLLFLLCVALLCGVLGRGG